MTVRRQQLCFNYEINYFRIVNQRAHLTKYNDYNCNVFNKNALILVECDQINAKRRGLTNKL